MEPPNHNDLHFEFGLDGKGWRFDLKCKGRIRLFLWVHAYYMIEFAAGRLAQERRFPFLWWHTLFLGMLCGLAALKILVWPSKKDVLALVGFDSITAGKLAGIKAALRQREDAHID